MTSSSSTASEELIPVMPTSTNVHRIERVISLAAAAGLLTWMSRTEREAMPDAARRAAPWVAGALLFRGLSGFCPFYGVLGVKTRSTDTRDALAGSGGLHIREGVTVNRPVADVYRAWRRFENLPRFMRHLESVKEIDERRSHWTTAPIAGRRYEWDAVIVNEVEDKVIGWRSLDNADVVSSGSVNFRETPGGATEVRVVLQYDPPAGKLGGFVAKLFGEDAASHIREDLRRFKSWMETGVADTPDTGTWREAGAGDAGRHSGRRDAPPF